MKCGVLAAHEKNVTLGLLDCAKAAMQQGLLIVVKGRWKNSNQQSIKHLFYFIQH
jgi:hypothetical protein